MDLNNGITKQCGICSNNFPATKEYFSKSSHCKDGLLLYCKKCDNNKRSIRYKTKASHNVNRRCKMCEGFFYAELTRVKRGGALFCSQSCSAKRNYYRPGNKTKKNFEMSRPSHVGELNPKAKLTKENVIAIKIALNDKVSTSLIGKKYNISTSNVCNIKSGRIWKHITVERNK